MTCNTGRTGIVAFATDNKCSLIVTRSPFYMKPYVDSHLQQLVGV